MLGRRIHGAALFVLGCLGLLFLPERLSAATPYPCHRASTPKFIDGRLTDWQEPFLSLDRVNWRPESGATPVYGGMMDISGTIRLAWDKDILYIAVVVVDDIFAPAKESSLDSGDAVIIRLAPAEVPAGTPCIPTELVFSLNEFAVVQMRNTEGQLVPAEGVKIGVARGTLPVPATPTPSETGKPQAKFIAKLWYELSVPWSLLPSVTPAEGGRLGMEAQILDSDAGALRGRLKWRGVQGVPRTATDLGCVQFTSPFTPSKSTKKSPP